MTSAEVGAQQKSTAATSVVAEQVQAIIDDLVATDEVDGEEEVEASEPGTPVEQVNDLAEPETSAGQALPTQPTDPSEPVALVELTNTLTYSPLSVTIAVGETVEWRNTSLMVHTVTADPSKATVDGSVILPSRAQPFDSGNLNPQATYRHTFRTRGTYRYFCIPHEGTRMRGTVIVQ
jgi:plastocyanin